MVRFVGLIISVTLHIITAIIAWRLMKLTKYRLSWILISIGLIFMAIRRVMDVTEFLNKDISYYLLLAADWTSILSSFFLIGGVILIREIFITLKRAEIERNRTEQRVLNAIIDTEEKERKRFAKELHDGLGPLLSTVKMSVSALQQAEHTEANIEIIKNTELIINEAIESIKEISNNISPHILSNFGLFSAINSFVEKINSTKTISINFSSNMPEKRVSRNIEIVTYRAVSELINNTIRHANAKNIFISLNYFQNLMTLEYLDDGVGFEVDKVLNDPISGMGYSNIQSRVKSINGLFLLESSKEQGTHALIKVNIAGQKLEND